MGDNTYPIFSPSESTGNCTLATFGNMPLNTSSVVSFGMLCTYRFLFLFPEIHKSKFLDPVMFYIKLHKRVDEGNSSAFPRSGSTRNIGVKGQGDPQGQYTCVSYCVSN